MSKVNVNTRLSRFVQTAPQQDKHNTMLVYIQHSSSWMLATNIWPDDYLMMDTLFFTFYSAKPTERQLRQHRKLAKTYWKKWSREEQLAKDKAYALSVINKAKAGLDE